MMDFGDPYRDLSLFRIESGKEEPFLAIKIVSHLAQVRHLFSLIFYTLERKDSLDI